ncbi:MAG: hypothetical protein NT145_03575 [Elusimicrobia bacterium]|nr:hypothetical protein [Elusimicrobiota bacterium]
MYFYYGLKFCIEIVSFAFGTSTKQFFIRLSRKAFYLALVFFIGQGLLFSSSGITSGEISTINPDPHTSSMGSSILASYYSPSSIFVNPAGMAQFYQPKFSFSNVQLTDDINYKFAGFVLPTENGNFSGGVSLLSYGNIQGYDTNGISYDIPTSEDMLFVLNFAFPLKRIIPVEKNYGSVGVNLKVINSSIAGYSANAVAFDLGCIFGIYEPMGLSGSFVFKNLGKSLNYYKKEAVLPTAFDIGMKYENPDIRNFTGVATISRTTNDELLTYACGASISPIYPLSVRIGWQETTDSLNSGLRGGLGLDFGNVSINYSAEPLKNFSMIQKIGIDIAFNNIVNPSIAYDYYLNKNFELAREKYLKGDYVDSRQRFEEILSLYPNHQPSKDYLAKIAQNLEKVEQKTQVKISRYLSKARLATYDNNLLKALKYYNYVLGIDPVNAQAIEGKKNIEESRQKLDRGKTRKKNESKIIELWSQAKELYDKSDYVSAKDKINELLILDPDNEEAKKYSKEINAKLEKISNVQIEEIYLKGVLLYSEEKYAEALKYFDSAILASPNRQDAVNYRNLCIKKLKEKQIKEKAEKSSDKDTKIKQEIDAQYQTALKLYNSGKFSEAMKAFSDIQKTSEDYSLNQYSENSRIYIFKIKSTMAENNFKTAQDYARKGNLEAAYEEYKKSLENNPEFSSARIEYDKVSELLSKRYYEEGTKEFSKGNQVKAKEYFQKSLRYKSDNVESQRALDRIK